MLGTLALPSNKPKIPLYNLYEYKSVKKFKAIKIPSSNLYEYNSKSKKISSPF